MGPPAKVLEVADGDQQAVGDGALEFAEPVRRTAERGSVTEAARMGGDASLEPIVTRNVPVPMRDGVTLYADIYRPAAPGAYPVLVMRVPYSKAHAQTVVYAHPYWYANRGYIVVVQDTRGRFESEGDFAPWVNEAVDGYDTVEWAAGLPHANGRVGMYGFSYAGSVQLQAAALRPPHLGAIAPAFASLEYYEDWIYPGGALSLSLIHI